MTSHNADLNKDTIGGASLCGFQGKTLDIDEPDIFALDIIDAPNLETIRFKRLNSLKSPHLVLSNLPALRRIVLPAGHPGAIVHVNCAAAPRPFVIDGAVGELDAAWDTTRFSMEAAPGKPHWSRVVFCAPAPDLPQPAGNGLVIVHGQMPDGLDQLTLAERHDWLLTGVAALRHIQINTSGKVVLNQLPDLRTLNSSGQGLVLMASETPALHRLSGTGKSLTLHQSRSGASRLTIADDWEHAGIHDSQLKELAFTNGASLTLHHCGSLTRVDLPLGMEVECRGALPPLLMNSARFYFDESSLNTSLEKFREGDDAHLTGILSVLANAYEPEQVVISLQKLHELCQLGVAPDLIWRTRRELAARHSNNRRRNKRQNRPFTEAAMVKADLYWHWRFPDDLAPQGWEADLNLWQHCQASVPQARDYGEIIVCTCSDETGMDALLRKGLDNRSDPALFNLAVEAMAEYLKKGHEFVLDRNRRLGNNPTFRLVRFLFCRHASNHSNRTAIAFLCDVLPLNTLVTEIPPVVHMDPGLFRGQLMALTRRPEGWFRARMDSQMFYNNRELEAYRRTLMQIALAPCTSEDEDETDDESEDEPVTGATCSLYEGGT
ncbi:MAG: hypothetical protein KGY54_14925 [Oleiphilaceae bacterium]|nr:hypothetical protein [Oleiphilaceae bacterium]